MSKIIPHPIMAQCARALGIVILILVPTSSYAAEDFARLNVTASPSSARVGGTVQLTVIGVRADGTEVNITEGAKGTNYSTSETLITLTENGLVTVNHARFRSVTETYLIWITVNNGSTAATIAFSIISTDSDTDEIDDDFERQHGLNPADPNDATSDNDSDGLTNLQEFQFGTDPNDSDTDGDEASDSLEVRHGSDPLNPKIQFVINENCTATVLNRALQVNPGGSFTVSNVPLPQGLIRARFVCETGNEVITAQSEFTTPVANGVTRFKTFELGQKDRIPVSLEITSPVSVLSPSTPSVQLTTTGTLTDRSKIDLTQSSTGTFYISSNPSIAKVSKDGLVEAVSSGNIIITAIREGVIATILLKVELTQDSDGDGMPDDYEQANSVNPGGANLARLPGTQVNASSFSSSFTPARAIDGNSQTSWFTGIGDAANKRSAPFIEVTLPNDVNVAQIRLLGNRQNAVGFDFFAGVFQGFDANGAEIFNSGTVQLPAPTRDVAVPLDLNGIRRVRFTSTADESNTPGLSEVQVVSRPGGPGLDPNNANDAPVDLDQDGLTNLQEFNLGTSIFLNDTDSDGLDDGQEPILGSNPILADTDGDGLLDGNEINPTIDSDGDGIKNILDPDSDNDGLPDGVEVALGLNPLLMDSNGNGIPDGSEDDDRDGLPNIEEISEHTDPTNPDTDGDKLLDGEEVIAGADGFITDPLRADTDGDGMPDGYESRFRVNRINTNEPGLNPTNPNDAGLDPDGDGLTNLQESALDTDPFNSDVTAPAVSQIDPPDGAMNFPVNGMIIVRFAEPLLPESVVNGVVRVVQDTTEIDGSVKLSNDGLSITFTPAEQLLALTPHTVMVQGVRDVAGNRMTQLFQSTFTTAVFVDTVAPFVLRTSPAQSVTGVPVNAPFTVEFNERMDPATLTPANFTIVDNISGQNVPGMVQVDPDGRTASFVPTRPYFVGRFHSVTLSSNIKDAAGNSLGFRFFSFTTSFTEDTVRPRLVATSPGNGDAGVPVNALVMLNFDEPLNTVNFLRGIRVVASGVSLPGSFALSDGNRRVTFTSAAALPANTLHAIVVDTEVTDLVGNPLDNPGSITFDTTNVGDIVFPTVTQVDPINGATGVATNAVVRLQFSERINPLTVTESNFFISLQSFGIRVPGSVTVAANGRSATFTPDAPLLGNTAYFVQAFSITDLAGHQVSFASTFTTGGGADATGPTVVTVSPPAGATNVPVNAHVVVQLSEPVSTLSVNGAAFTLTQSGTPVAGAITLSNDRRSVTFTPTNALATSSNYTINVSTLTDLSGNAMTPFSSSFTTSASSTADTTRPSVLSVSPLNNATGVAVNTQIVVTFNEVIDATTVNSNTVSVTIDSFSGIVPGSYAVNGAALTFTPASPLPANVRVRVSIFNVRDLANNENNFFGSSFVTTADTPDTTPPQVVMVTPSDGATNITINTPVILTFSEPLDPNTLFGNNIALFANGDRLFPSINRSADNRTITVSQFLPANSVITVAVTSDVKDLSGNRLTDFRSQFTTGGNFDTGAPFVVNQRPGNGVNGVPLDSRIGLYINEPLNPLTVGDALHVSQNGVLVDGTINVTGNGQVIEFVPAAPWQRNALIQIFFNSTAKDLTGISLNSYEGTFRTILDTSNTAPHPVLVSPVSQSGLMLNPVFEVEYNEPLDVATVNGNNVFLQRSGGGLVPSTVTLVRDGRVVRLVPNAPLLPNDNYFITLNSNIRDLDGSAQPFVFQRSFTTATQTDNTVPQVLTVTPPNGSTNVGINASLRVRFNEPINPLSANGAGIFVTDGTHTSMASSISFSNNNQDVVIVPQAALPESTLLTLKVEGVEDLAGNLVAPQTTQFTTGPGPDLKRAQVIRTNPFFNATNVPVSTLITVEADEPIDAGTVNNNTFFVRDNVTFQNVAGTVSVSPDGRLLTFMPDAPLAVGRSYSVFTSFSGILDLAGNFLESGNFSFTTSFTPDTTGPKVLATSPGNGLTSVPTNAAVTIRFDEPVQSLNIDQVTLSAGGVNVNVSRTLSNSNQTLTLKPVTLLAGLTTYNLSISGVKDLTGNTLAASINNSFTTAAGVDLTNPTVTQVDPASGATGVATNAVVKLQFSERINPASVTDSTFFLAQSSTGLRVVGTITVAVDGRSLTFTPASPLFTNASYFMQAFSITDLAGHQVSFSSSFSTGGGTDVTGPTVVAVTPPAGATNVPVNARVVVQVNEPVSVLGIGSNALTLTQSGSPVAGTVTLSNDRTSLTFAPATPLATSSSYNINVSGFTDLSGNPVTAFSSSFTTSASSTADITRPSVLSVSPLNNATGVPVNTQVVLTFSEVMDPTSINEDTVQLTIDGFSGILAGSYAVNGATVTFTPATPLPANVQARVRAFNVFDLAGNNNGFFQSLFTTTAATPDTTPPQVVMITPSDGTSAVPFGTRIIVTFSESLDAITINNNSVALFSNGDRVFFPSITRSADNRTITISSSLPANSLITVALTSDIKDLSGNRLADFQSKFTTAPTIDNGNPFVISQRPGSGANEVPLNSSIVLYISEPLDTATISDALHVSQNGVLVAGTINITGNGQVIEFVPAAPWQRSSLIQIFLDSTAKDLAGNPLGSYQGTFRTVVDTTNTAPHVVRTSPFSFSGVQLLNLVFEVEYNEPLDPATINGTNVSLRQSNNGALVAATVSLIRGGRVVRLVPDAPLLANTSYIFSVNTNIRDLDGAAPVSFFNVFFTTEAITDNTKPQILSVSPPDGATGVGVNANIRVLFDEPINPLSVNGATILVTDGTHTSMPSSISFSNNNREVLITPQAPLPETTQLALKVEGVEDFAGNLVTPQTTHFTTGTGADLTRAQVVRTNPFNGATNVSVNSLITLEVNEAVDPGTVNNNTFRVRENTTFQDVAGTLSVSADGRLVTFMPNPPLVVSRSHSVFFSFNGILDLAGNFVEGTNFSFTTSSAPDTTAPQVLSLNPSNGFTAVPTNVGVTIQFNEPIQSLSIDQVTLSAGGVNVNVNRLLSNGNQTLTLKPSAPLAGLTTYNLSISGVKDLSGNVLAATVNSSFTTAAGVDLINPTVTQVDPANNATGVATNAVVKLQLSERINPLTVSESTFFFGNAQTGLRVNGSFAVAADGLSITFTPSAPLLINTRYFMQVSSITDLAGHSVSFFSSTFTTGSQ